jgi:RNA polymerase sigma-70 factor (ECF subfamily)
VNAAVLQDFASDISVVAPKDRDVLTLTDPFPSTSADPHADEAAVDSARAGDPAAWEHLYRRVYPRLAAYLARRVGPDHAEDTISETMTRAVAGLDSMALGPAGFDGWVFGIARRVAADHHRKAGRRRRQDQAAVVLSGPEASADSCADGVVEADEYADLKRLFCRLRPDEQELLELRVVAGLSAEQVAAVLGKRPGAVRTAQSRALARLRALMEREHG